MMHRMDCQALAHEVETAAPTPVRIEVVADCLSGLPLRVLGVFAAQDLVLPDFGCRIVGDRLRMCFTMPVMPPQHAAIALARIDAIVGVIRVRARIRKPKPQARSKSREATPRVRTRESL